MAVVAHAGELPQAQLDAAVGRKDWSDNVYYGASFRDKLTWNNTAVLSLSYNLDLWDRNRNTTERAQDEIHAVAADARAAQLELESNVVRTYVQLSLQYGLLDSAQDTLKQEQQILDLANRRFRGGIGTQMEITQAEVPLPETRRQIEVFNENIALTRNQLAALLGEGPGAGDNITRPVMNLQAALGLPSALPAELIGRRPDIRARGSLGQGHRRGQGGLLSQRQPVGQHRPDCGRRRFAEFPERTQHHHHLRPGDFAADL